MTAADLSDELTRQRAITRVADMRATAWEDLADSLADNLAALLICLGDCGILTTIRNGQHEAIVPSLIPVAERRALADAIRGARAALDEMHGAYGGDDDEPTPQAGAA